MLAGQTSGPGNYKVVLSICRFLIPNTDQRQMDRIRSGVQFIHFLVGGPKMAIFVELVDVLHIVG